jgi:uncharacterized protein with FMN-binding domain
MRRAPIVIPATAAGLAAVLGFHAHQPVRATASATASAGSSGSASSSGSSTSSGSGSSKTATGAAEQTQYGNAQVRVTVSGGKITKIETLQLQGNDPKSVQISSSAEPILQQEALTKQSSAIDVVSGATFTSTSYELSLQSALDKLGYKAPDGSRTTVTIPQGGGDHGGF